MLIRSVLLIGICSLSAGVLVAQQNPQREPDVPNGGAKPGVAVAAPAAIAITPAMSASELAHAALAAHGGDKLKRASSIVMIGSADMYVPDSTQGFPAKFAMIFSGDKARLEIQSMAINMKFIQDGARSYSSVKGFAMPSLNNHGLRLLIRIDDAGYVVSALPDRKKERAFRITAPDGESSDFYVDSSSGRVKSYEYSVDDKKTAIAHDHFKEIDGVVLPDKFVQRMELPQGTFFAEFNAKEVKVNSELDQDVFAIPQ
jgi:hypothetical protein